MQCSLSMMKMYIETDGVHLKRHVMFIINDEDVHRKLMMYKTNREFQCLKKCSPSPDFNLFLVTQSLVLCLVFC